MQQSDLTIEKVPIQESNSDECSSRCESNSNYDQDQESEFGSKIDPTIPDGGFVAWMQVLGAWTAIIMTFGFSSGTSVLMSWLEKNYLKDYSPSRIGWMFSVQLFLMYFGGIEVGPIFDAYGARVLIIPGCIGFTASIFILSACKRYYEFVLCYSILGGLSSALIFNPCVTVLSHWFSKRRGFAIGIAASGSGIGGIIFSQMSNRLLAKVGYGWTVRAMAFVVLACAIISILTLHSRHKAPSINWEDSKPDFRALLEVPFFFCVVGLFLVEWGIFVPMQYIVSYAVDRGFTRTFGTDLVAYLSTASVVTRVCVGFLSDRVGSFNMMSVAAFLAGLMCLTVWLTVGDTKAGLVTFCVIFGIFSGAVVSLTLICVPQLAHVKNAGRRYGTAYMIASFAVLTGIPLAGALTAHHYIGVVIFSGVVYLAGALSFLLSRYFAVRWQLIY